MICNKCKKNISNKVSVCPYCATKVKKSISTNKGVKNKFIQVDNSLLVGGTVTNNKGSFIKLEKNKKNTNVDRRKYINYIDYKEAKKEQDRKNYINNNSKNGKFFSVLKNIDEINENGKVSTLATKKSGKERLKELKESSAKDTLNIGSKVTKSYSNKVAKKIVNNKENVQSKKPILNIEESSNVKKGKYFNLEVELLPIKTENKKVRKAINFVPYLTIIVLWIIVIGFVVTTSNNGFYFKENEEDVVKETITEDDLDQEMAKYEGISKSGQSGGTASEGVTSIVYDNQYLQQFVINNENDVKRLIETDSVRQKNNCPSKVVKIEEEIMKYGITAVNLCEIDEDFALELKQVVQYIYFNYPTARYYLTNLTLANVDENSSFIAAFMPIFTFSTSNTNTGYPIAVKTQILLNAKYFLNLSKISNSVKYGAKSGYFPPNATRSSTVAHEFGHYLSYVALLNHYNSKKLNFVQASQVATLYDVYDDFNSGEFSRKLLEEAYDTYKKTYGVNFSFNEFRESISTYAVAKDESGSYIYDETIAEAFHDCYLNGESAETASKVIMQTLVGKL